MARGLELGDLRGLFQPKPFCDSVKEGCPSHLRALHRATGAGWLPFRGWKNCTWTRVAAERICKASKRLILVEQNI